MTFDLYERHYIFKWLRYYLQDLYDKNTRDLTWHFYDTTISICDNVTLIYDSVDHVSNESSIYSLHLAAKSQ